MPIYWPRWVALSLYEMRRLEPDSPTVQELKTLTRDQDSLIQTQTRMPQPADGLPQGILSCRATLVYPHCNSAAHSCFCRRIPPHKWHRLLPLKRSEPLCEPGSIPARHGWLPRFSGNCTTLSWKPPRSLYVRASRLMLSLAKQLLVVIEDIATYDEEIETLFLTHEDHELWSSLPRAGQRLAPRLLAEWGDDRARYTDARPRPNAGRDSSRTLPKWQLRQSPQTLCLLETLA
jgi:hypothetical protein